MVKEIEGNMDVEITGLQMDSRKVEKGNLFICVPAIKGFLEDRHQYAKDAIRNGAVALLVERDVDIDVQKYLLKMQDMQWLLLLRIFIIIPHMR